MPKDPTKAAKIEQDGVETTALKQESYFCPNVGHGISVMASSPKEAQEKAAKLREELK
jgi:hypothetical protein